jgi:hypothetical protein
MADRERGTDPAHGDNGTRVAFVDRALETVRRIADSVDEPRLQHALDADTDDAVLTALGLRRTSASALRLAKDPLAAAKARGEQTKRDILAAQGDMLDSAAVANRLQVSIAEVHTRRQSGLLLALPNDHRDFSFPSWQFAEHTMIPGLEEVLKSMAVRSPWMRAQFFLSSDLRLNGQTPLAALLHGKIDAVRDAGAAYGEQLAS